MREDLINLILDRVRLLLEQDYFKEEIEFCSGSQKERKTWQEWEEEDKKARCAPRTYSTKEYYREKSRIGAAGGLDTESGTCECGIVGYGCFCPYREY